MLRHTKRQVHEVIVFATCVFFFSCLLAVPFIGELKHDVNGKRQTAKIRLSGVCFKPFVH